MSKQINKKNEIDPCTLLFYSSQQSKQPHIKKKTKKRKKQGFGKYNTFMTLKKLTIRLQLVRKMYFCIFCLTDQQWKQCKTLHFFLFVFFFCLVLPGCAICYCLFKITIAVICTNCNCRLQKVIWMFYSYTCVI